MAVAGCDDLLDPDHGRIPASGRAVVRGRVAQLALAAKATVARGSSRW